MPNNLTIKQHGTLSFLKENVLEANAIIEAIIDYGYDSDIRVPYRTVSVYTGDTNKEILEKALANIQFATSVLIADWDICEDCFQDALDEVIALEFGDDEENNAS